MTPRKTVILMAVAVAIFAVNTIRYSGHQIDDSFISFRYARNLVEGEGLVFNPGERVEGYTNFLFVLAAALIIALGVDPLLGTGALVFAAALATLFITDRLDRGPPSSRQGLSKFPLAAGLLLSLESFAYWSVVSLETMVFSLLLVMGIYFSHREIQKGKGILSSFSFLLLSLTRPEGALCYAVIWPVSFILARRKSGSWSHLPNHVARGIIYAAGLGLYLGWRWSYYGSLVPNTYRAKVTWGAGQFETGLAYLGDWAASFPLVAATLLSPVLLLPWLVRRGGLKSMLPRLIPDDSPLHLILPLAYVYLVYTVLVGGDHMPFYRFSVLILPLLCLAAAGILRGLPAIEPTLPVFVRGFIALLLVGHISASYFTTQGYRAFVAHRTAVVGAATGSWFGAHLDAEDLMAVNTIGTLPYSSRLRTIDMLGLTDSAIAGRPIFVDSRGWAGHRRGWGRYVMDNRPRAIVWYNSAGSIDPFYLGDRELASDPFFRFFYRLKKERLPALDEGAGKVLRRFIGYPFGQSDTEVVVSGDLGLRAILRTNPIRYTAFKEGPIILHYFELDPRDEELWGLREKSGHNSDRFVDLLAARWQRRSNEGRTFDTEARNEVNNLLKRVYVHVQAGEYPEAKKLLSDAAALNASARSPLVFQYIANVAVQTGEIWAALSAQKEALRLAPDNDLYITNLKKLMKQPLPSSDHGRTVSGRGRAGMGR
jgi:arabinofuranosyltransferase